MVLSPGGSSPLSPRIWLTVIVCGLGYFVDIYDLILFSIVRTQSLIDIGVTADRMQDASELILNSQMIGMLLGGLLFGVLADRKGRLSVMLGSILLYSIMNIMNAFVSSVEMYAIFRFLSGIGLAGELGVAVTLVAEIMPVKSRGYGTTIVASMGILGAVAAYLVAEFTNWQTAFVAGGVMGLLLLVTRVRIHESGMFRAAERSDVSRGNVAMLFSPSRIGRYLSSIAIGVPIWYVIGILVTFAPEFTSESSSTPVLMSGGMAVMWAYVGLSFGDLCSGLLSQLLKSRRAAILVFILLTAASAAWYLTSTDKTPVLTYFQCALLGFSVGYWAVFVTTAAEQFGTNLRATAATTVPNFVRGSLALLILLFKWLRTDVFGGEGMETPRISAALVVGALCIAIAILGWLGLKETYGKDLEFVER